MMRSVYSRSWAGLAGPGGNRSGEPTLTETGRRATCFQRSRHYSWPQATSGTTGAPVAVAR